MTDQPPAAPRSIAEADRSADLPILIAGAGIAGLAAALALARTGRTVTVLEKRAAAPEEGAGIQIGPNGSRILKELGVARHLSHLIAAPESIHVMDGLTGQGLTRLPLGRTIEERHGAPYWVLHRADLHGALRAAASAQPLITLREAAEVTGASSDPAGVTVRLADATSLRGTALLGADGLWSAVRSAVFAPPPLVFTGKCALRAVIPADALPPSLSAADTTIWLRPAAHIVHYPVRGGREIAIVAIFDDKELGETWAGTVELASVASRTAGFPAALRTLLARPTLWRQWSLYAPAAPMPWVSGRIALIGDAAHPPLPFLAQGGVMALEDAVVLAALIAGATAADLPSRLMDYERRRRPRTTHVMETSARNGRIYHLDGVMRLARNAVLRSAPPAVLIGRYDWIYGWQPDRALSPARIPA